MESSDHGRCSSLSIENDLPDNQNNAKTYDMIRWKSGKRVDPRLLMLLESFVEIYMDLNDFFVKIFNGNHEELFDKIGHAMKMKMKKVGSMSRSMSTGAIKERGVDDDGVRLERFKVKTPDVKVAAPDGGQGGQTQTIQGSNNSK
ncbi:hypothetical protein BUALT_Bualt06G0032500 [Buddleja alternifolia]|uniref:Uncharacterized protein n=1 Tax=Buddleja alternifolia TaxID=168488 RepID=A0AAV6XGW1_9LAMI|nr:hypothetical protein BUALT_Bualt06G0032500 [Buddleja alternifolia]